MIDPKNIGQNSDILFRKLKQKEVKKDRLIDYGTSLLKISTVVTLLIYQFAVVPRFLF